MLRDELRECDEEANLQGRQAVVRCTVAGALISVTTRACTPAETREDLNSHELVLAQDEPCDPAEPKRNHVRDNDDDEREADELGKAPYPLEVARGENEGGDRDEELRLSVLESRPVLATTHAKNRADGASLLHHASG